jgi:hypothetical protein
MAKNLRLIRACEQRRMELRRRAAGTVLVELKPDALNHRSPLVRRLLQDFGRILR